MRITVVGGGNIGTQFMVHCASKGHDVTAYTSKPEVFGSHLNIVDENDVTTLEGDIRKATNDPSEAFSTRKIIPDLHSRYFTADFSYSDYGIMVLMTSGSFT